LPTGCQTLKLDKHVEVIKLAKQDAGGRTPLPPPKAHSLRSWSLPAWQKRRQSVFLAGVK